MPTKQGYKKVLVAVDGSEVSLRAVEHAARLARHEGGELFGLHVVPAPPFEFPGELADYYANARNSASRWMKEVEATASRHGVKIHTEILIGAYSVLDAIIGYAESIACDLIVTGTRGKTPSRRILMGSVASGLVEYASCPVLIIR